MAAVLPRCGVGVAERLQGLLGVMLYLLPVLYFQCPLMRDAIMCLWHRH